MASLRGPRRTRVYNANYNIGESYYKSALDKLDRKYSGRPDPLESSITSSPRIRFNLDDGFDDDLQAARTRASRAITEEPVFDSRGKRTIPGLPLSSAFEDDIDEEASLSRIRANRPRATSLMRELDMDDSFTSSRIKRRMNNFDMDMAGDDDIGKSSIKSRALKMISRTSAAAEDIDEPIVSSAKSIVSSFKRTAITDSSESSNSAASLRAKATKARLADIESDMTERSEKLLQRERRAANLKKILADNDIEEVKASKKVTF